MQSSIRFMDWSLLGEMAKYLPLVLAGVSVVHEMVCFLLPLHYLIYQPRNLVISLRYEPG